MDVATIKPYGEIDGLVIVVAEIVFAVKPPVNIVAPETVPPVKLPPLLDVIPVTLNVPPVLFVNVIELDPVL